MAAVPESPLEDGLTALKQGNFDRAIAEFETVCQNSSQPTATKVEAQKGLVDAYVGKGEDRKAIYLLEILSQSSDPQVRKWATDNYPQLVKPLPIDATGFVAFEEVQQKVIQQEVVSVAVEPVITPVEQALTKKALTPFEWRNAPRAQRWQPLEEVNLVPLWLLMAGSVTALFLLL